MLPSRIELRAEKARRSLSAFIREAWPLVEPATAFGSNWHIDAIAERLEAASRGELRRLLINIPPRHMKSLQVAVFWPAWVWLSQPERRFLYASYAERLSVSHSVVCRRLIQSAGGARQGTLLERLGYQGVLGLLGGDWHLAHDQNAKERFHNSRGGFRLASSVGGSVTGEGGDVLVLDDPHKPDEVGSDRVRQAGCSTGTTRSGRPGSTTPPAASSW